MLQRHRPLRGANKRLIGHRSPQANLFSFSQVSSAILIFGTAANSAATIMDCDDVILFNAGRFCSQCSPH